MVITLERLKELEMLAKRPQEYRLDESIPLMELSFLMFVDPVYGYGREGKIINLGLYSRMKEKYQNNEDFLGCLHVAFKPRRPHIPDNEYWDHFDRDVIREEEHRTGGLDVHFCFLLWLAFKGSIKPGGRKGRGFLDKFKNNPGGGFHVARDELKAALEAEGLPLPGFWFSSEESTEGRTNKAERPKGRTYSDMEAQKAYRWKYEEDKTCRQIWEGLWPDAKNQGASEDTLKKRVQRAIKAGRKLTLKHARPQNDPLR